MNLPALIPRAKNKELPALIASAGPAARFVWGEYFSATIRNRHTRLAYLHAVRRFLGWAKRQGTPLERITPEMVGDYFDEYKGTSPATRKLHLAALRGFFDRLVNRHVILFNPTHSVRGERHQDIEGKTPEITADQARKLIASIPTVRVTRQKPGTGPQPEDNVVPCIIGLRDRAIIAMMIFTAARAGAIAKLRLEDFQHDGSHWSLRFEEKGGKSREIPVRHDLEVFILDYLRAARLISGSGDSPLFQSAVRRSGRLSGKALTGGDLCRMLKRRLRAAGLPCRISPHSFRVLTVTDLLTQGVPLEDVQYLAGHSDARTTRLYDRRTRRVTRNIVERISLNFEEPCN
jgi:integrase/recombinase XerD